MRIMRSRRIGTTDALKRVVAGLVVAGLSSAVAQQPVQAQTIQAKKPKPPTTATIVDLGILGEGPSVGYGINNSGQVTGDSYVNIYDVVDGVITTTQVAHAFLYSNGAMTDLGVLPGADNSRGRAINDSGQVAGDSSDPSTPFLRAFRYSNGVMNDLGTLPGGSESHAYAINNAGQVAGYSSTDVMSPGAGGFYHAFRYSNGVMTDLGTLGGPTSFAYAINNNGQVAGSSDISLNSSAHHAFVHINGVMTDLGTLGGANVSSSATGINDLGQVVGSSGVGDNSATHAFLYSNNRMIDLGTLPGFLSSYARDVNNIGQVVGQVRETNGYEGIYLAFLYSGGQMIHLNDLLPANSGWTLVDAASINDKGQVTGGGYRNGEYRAYLLTLPKVLPGAGSASIKGNGTLGNAGRSIQTNFVARNTSKKALGNVVFTDKINNIALKSTEITSVQVSGDEGVIYGVGRVNGVDGFSFVLTTTDDVSSNKGGDGFSLQISNGYTHTSDFNTGGVRVAG